MLALFKGLHGRDFFDILAERDAIHTLQLIHNVLDDERNTDFECVEEITRLLWEAGISTNRHDFG